MNLKEEKEARLKYIRKVYSLIKEEDPISPTSLIVGLSRYGKMINGKFELSEKKSSGYIIGKDLGLSMDQVDAIVSYYVSKGYFSSFIGMGAFQFTDDGIEYVENLDELNSSYPLNFINVTGDINGNLQIQQASTSSNQTQNVSINKTNFKEFYEALSKDLSNMDLSEDLKEDILSELEYAKRQNSKDKNITQQMENIGCLLKEVGIGVFTNLVASPVFELIRPTLGV